MSCRSADYFSHETCNERAIKNYSIRKRVVRSCAELQCSRDVRLIDSEAGLGLSGLLIFSRLPGAVSTSTQATQGWQPPPESLSRANCQVVCCLLYTSD